MSFYSELIDWIRGKVWSAKQVMRPRPVDFVFGSIISGQYTNWKTDPHPTILCLGNYMKPNGRWYVHGIQLHAIDNSDLAWLMNLINSMKVNGTTTNPRAFYYYLKMNRYSVVRNGYRIYHSEMTNFKTIHPGFSNISQELCLPITDMRDEFLKPKPINPTIDQTELRENITRALNSKKIWK